MDWTSGYLAEIDYTHGYYREMAPSQIDLALLMTGHEPPGGSGGRYLELGCGQGLSANIHAAATGLEVWAADFNPAHIANARDLARRGGSGARFIDDSFAELANRDDLPGFDHITLHGVWSWVSDDNRQAIVDILRRRLNVGGVVYISYNCLPGWAPSMPLRQVIALHADLAGAEAQGVVGRIDAALGFAGKLADAGARYFTANANAKSRLDAVVGQNRHYVAHEYFNRDWAPMYFSDVHARLAEAKTTYACAATLLEQMDGFNLTAAQQEVLGEFSNTLLRETVRDFLINQQFRKDLSTRGARRLSPMEQRERLFEVAVMLAVPREEISLDIEAGLGKVGLKPEIYQPIIDALAADDGSPKRIGDLAILPSLAVLPVGALSEGLAVLIGSGRAHPAQAQADCLAAAPRCRALNAAIIERARFNGDIAALASPVIGAGVPVGRFEQMFLGARARGLAGPAAWAADAWDTLARQGQEIIKDGEVLRGRDANLQELERLARALDGPRLDALRRLRVTD